MVITLVLLAQGYFTSRRNHDRLIEADLQRIQTSISNYTVSKHALPQNLAMLGSVCDAYSSYGKNRGFFDFGFNDVKTASKCISDRFGDYTYSTKDQAKYEICATFLTGDAKAITPASGYVDTGRHTKGYYCFEFTEYNLQIQNYIVPRR